MGKARLIVAVAAVFAMTGLGGCNSKHAEEVSACVLRGTKYFREIGSYPTLKTAPNKGRKAIDVARERCRRTTTAFPK